MRQGDFHKMGIEGNARATCRKYWLNVRTGLNGVKGRK